MSNSNCNITFNKDTENSHLFENKTNQFVKEPLKGMCNFVFFQWFT